MTSHDSTDRQEIRELCAHYAIALDDHAWSTLERVFAADATMTFAHLGEVESVSAIAETCRRSLESLDASQHLIGTVLAEVEGDEARCTSYFQAQHIKSGTEGGDQLLVGGRYDDVLVRGPRGWRIIHRTQVVTWTSGNPRVVF